MSPQGRRGALTGGLWLAVSNLLSLVSTLAVSVVVGRVLGPEGLGHQTYIAYVSGLLFGLIVGTTTNLALRVVSQAHGRDAPGEVAELHFWSAVVQVASSVLVALVLLVLGSNTSLWQIWTLAAATAILDGIFWAQATYMIATRGWNSVARARLASLVSASAMGVAAVLLGAGITALFVANLLASLGLVIWMVGHSRHVPIRASAFPVALIVPWLSFLALGALSQIVNQRIELLFLGHWSTVSEVAIYSVAFTLVSSAGLLLNSIISGAMPAIAAQEGAGRISEIAESLSIAIRIAAVFASVLAAGVAGLGPPLVRLMYGTDFLRSASLLPELSTVIVASTVSALCWTFCAGTGRLRVPLLAGVFAALVDVGLAFALIPRMGAEGAALSNIGGQAALLVALLFMVKREFPFMRYGLLAIALPVALVVLLGLGAVEIVSLIGYDTVSGAITAMLAGGAFLLVGGSLVGAIVGYVRGDDANWLRSAVPEAFHFLLPLVLGSSGRER